MKSETSYLLNREFQAFSSPFQFLNSTRSLKTVSGNGLNPANLLPPTDVDPFQQLLKLYPLQEDNLSLSAFVEKTKAERQQETAQTPLVTKQLLPEDFFSQSIFLTWLADENNNLVYANQGLLRFFNIENKDLNNKISCILPGSIREKIATAHVSVRSTGAPYKNVLVYPNADGSNYYFLINIYPAANSQNLLVGEAFDITQRFQMFREMNRMNEHLINLLNATADAIWEYDFKSGYLFQNEKLSKLVDTTTDKIVDLHGWHNLIHPQDRAGAKEKIESTLKGKKTSWEHEYRIKGRDKNYITLKENGYITYQNGAATKIVASLRDISEVKVLRSELTHEKINNDKKLTETALHAQETERIRIGNELHDNVNQLLASSKLFLELVKTKDDESNHLKGMVGQYIETAVKEIRSLSHGLVVANFDQTGLIGSFNKILDDLASANTFSISFKSDNRIELLKHSKKIALFRIFQEQLKNIIKHSKATKINVELSIINNKAQLYIKDNGVGFNHQQRRKGIGLSNIYNRTKLCNGTVEFVTAPGQGCELKILLPAKRIK